MASNPTSAATYQGHLTAGDGMLASRLHKPTHPSLVQVVFNNGSYNSHLISLQNFSRGDLITPFSPHADFASTKSYSTVQTGPSTHIELNSDLLYCNHSCDPNVAFVIGDAKDKSTWKARAEKDIKKGDILTFFYPSTEWQMSQPFDCSCGSSKHCLGNIDGAHSIDPRTLKKYFVNDHIRALKRNQIENDAKLDAEEKQELLKLLS
ncbi:galactose-proton symport [Pseudozyma hubeiensis SY62]|uniref:Galactose-proton symport n=1 Tax=Pseudozyma hubeiensis (strain SY62) TaxID=1305764 RepID=R9PAP7_PSEHS|nr:galactose-proton symport [Pseudozyma hubeiensis SY62]GAC98302.1 galactose-proton symport [Pseudozyma hubeiensis SY62]